MTKIEFKPIGYIRSKYKSFDDAPPSSRLNKEQGELHLYKKYAAGLKEIDGFSHLLVVFYFHKLGDDFDLIIHPRSRHDLDVGLFATHSPRRPNRIGVSVIEVVKVKGNVIYFQGVDMLDGSPVLDIKPIAADIKVKKSGWLKSRKDKP